MLLGNVALVAGSIAGCAGFQVFKKNFSSKKRLDVVFAVADSGISKLGSAVEFLGSGKMLLNTCPMFL